MASSFVNTSDLCMDTEKYHHDDSDMPQISVLSSYVHFIYHLLFHMYIKNLITNKQHTNTYR